VTDFLRADSHSRRRAKLVYAAQAHIFPGEKNVVKDADRRAEIDKFVEIVLDPADIENRVSLSTRSLKTQDLRRAPECFKTPLLRFLPIARCILPLLRQTMMLHSNIRQEFSIIL
jgi:hypothetical protein